MELYAEKWQKSRKNANVLDFFKGIDTIELGLPGLPKSTWIKIYSMEKGDIFTLTGKIIGAYFNVYNKLGYGFLEKVYENAFVRELEKNELKVKSQVPISVYYDNVEVGNYFADILVENSVVVELKACSNLAYEHEVQLLNYLKATEIKYGLLFNFGKTPEFKRKVWLKDYKKSITI